jgi:hypothetical protein
VKQKTNYLDTVTSDAPPSQAQILAEFITPLNTSTLLDDLHNNQAGSGSKDLGMDSSVCCRPHGSSTWG